jgi:hypothetical protein
MTPSRSLSRRKSDWLTVAVSRPRTRTAAQQRRLHGRRPQRICRPVLLFGSYRAVAARCPKPTLTKPRKQVDGGSSPMTALRHFIAGKRSQRAGHCATVHRNQGGRCAVSRRFPRPPRVSRRRPRSSDTTVAVPVYRSSTSAGPSVRRVGLRRGTWRRWKAPRRTPDWRCVISTCRKRPGSACRAARETASRTSSWPPAR